MKPMKLLLPALFLLTLGLGNIAVGSYKQAQFELVLRELSATKALPEQMHISPLLRIQISKPATERLYQRQQKARGRCDFYRLVVLGGKLFLLLSGALLIGAVSLQLTHRRAG
jgi:hypothetical protein